MAAKANYKIHLQIDERYADKVSSKNLRATIVTALMQQKATRGSLSLTVSGDATLKRLNKKYLQHNYATDVLSFPSEDLERDDHARYYGDIVVSYARVFAQAQAGGHSPQAELQLLVVHGVLHLLGYDHYTAAQKKKMWAAQKKILKLLNCEITEPKE